MVRFPIFLQVYFVERTIFVALLPYFWVSWLSFGEVAALAAVFLEFWSNVSSKCCYSLLLRWPIFSPGWILKWSNIGKQNKSSSRKSGCRIIWTLNFYNLYIFISIFCIVWVFILILLFLLLLYLLQMKLSQDHRTLRVNSKTLIPRWKLCKVKACPHRGWYPLCGSYMLKFRLVNSNITKYPNTSIGLHRGSALLQGSIRIWQFFTRWSRLSPFPASEYWNLRGSRTEVLNTIKIVPILCFTIIIEPTICHQQVHVPKSWELNLYRILILQRALENSLFSYFFMGLKLKYRSLVFE